MRPRVLVTDATERAALSVVRSLGRAGYDVEVVGPQRASAGRRSLAGASRHARAEHSAPDPLEDPDGFAERVRAIVRARAPNLLLPVTEPSLLSLLPRRDALAGARVPFPSFERWCALSDKAEVLARAAEVGIPVPAQLRIERPDASPRSATLPAFPLVVKSARSIARAHGRAVRTRVEHVTSLAGLREHLGTLPRGAFPLLVQERIDGRGEGVFLLLWEGRLVAAFQHRRIREKPPTGGVSVYRESIPLDAELLERSTALLRRFGWSGVAMIEYRRGCSDARAYLMEVNARFWGSLQLAVDAGVDFPRLLVECALGGAPEPVLRYRTGVRSRWWLGDLDHLLIRLRRPPARDGLPPGSARTRAGAAARFLLPWRPGDRSEVLRLSDPVPGVVELREWLRAARAGAGTESRADAGRAVEGTP